MHFHGFTTFNSKHVKTFKRKTCDMNAGTVAGVQQSPIDNPRFANLRRVLKSLADAGCGTIRFSGDASRSLQVPAWDCRAWQVIWTLPAWQWPKLKTRKYRPCDLPWSLPSTSQTESSWVKLLTVEVLHQAYLILSFPGLLSTDVTVQTSWWWWLASLSQQLQRRTLAWEEKLFSWTAKDSHNYHPSPPSPNGADRTIKSHWNSGPPPTLPF